MIEILYLYNAVPIQNESSAKKTIVLLFHKFEAISDNFLFTEEVFNVARFSIEILLILRQDPIQNALVDVFNLL